MRNVTEEQIRAAMASAARWDRQQAALVNHKRLGPMFRAAVAGGAQEALLDACLPIAKRGE